MTEVPVRRTSQQVSIDVYFRVPCLVFLSHELVVLEDVGLSAYLSVRRADRKICIN